MANAFKSTRDVALSASERKPLHIDGELSSDGISSSSAIPFAGENLGLFLRLLGVEEPQTPAPGRPHRTGS